MLGSRYSLHDLDDVEALCVRSARTWLRKTGAGIDAHDFEDLVQFLLAAVWRASERYDPAKSSSFEAVVRGWIGNRCTDWFRSRFGRTRWQFGGHTYEREIPRQVSLDNDSGDTLGSSLAAVGIDHLDDRLSALAWVHGVGSGELDWHKAHVRAAAARRAKSRAGAARERSQVAKQAAVF